ncbi:hypothetical protein GSY69_06520 [Brevibacterium sp. 5221]|uniref:SAF domain-containing protein n=1 Tax=Brevibacterium rongguiense TaxID=2695267 RepID=A0A6N9H6X4_9MICO|nr:MULTISPECIES: hypothetical protein [Brevibacterium]MYM19631.1 hypothetical protein [Brevibacterium rongguiense]WAL40350.1 hypothetical protein BRM1_00270 [Brevibacterium sp. BRM-1]
MPTHGSSRFRRPRWRDPRVLIGAVLVLASLLGTWYVVRAAARTTTVWAAGTPLVPGAVIAPEDLVPLEVRLPEGESAAAYIPSATRIPEGSTVLSAVRKGELLPAGSLASPDSLAGRVMALAAADALPAAVGAGSRVDVWATPDEDGAKPHEILRTAQVIAVTRDDGGFAADRGARIEVFVPTAALSGVLAAVGAGERLAVVAVPEPAAGR